MKYISFLLFVCMHICASSHSVTAMQRLLEEDNIKETTFFLLNLNKNIQNEVFKQITSRPEQVQVPDTTLRLVCKMTYEFCDNDKKWIFTNTNYPLFKKEMGKPWVDLLLSQLFHLSLDNCIELSALDDDLDCQEWEAEYIFISSKDLEYIKKHALKLKQLYFHNVPFLITPTKSTFACSTSLESFGFHYDTIIFDNSISSTELYDCEQFINLKSMMINSGVFFSGIHSAEEQITNFFSSLTNLESLRLYDVEADGENEKYSTNLFKSLTCLAKLDNLQIVFVDKPDLLPLINLSSLGLKSLLIIFEIETAIESGKIEHEDEEIQKNIEDVNYSGILPSLLTALPDLESIAFYNIWVEIFGPEKAEIISNNELVLKKYPQLKEVRGNDAISFDSKDNNDG
ncbi:MAG: hypothetical protein ACOH2E_04710 [Candidatus Paracaedibacter sp.]